MVKSEINYSGCGSRRGDATWGSKQSSKCSFNAATNLWASFKFTYNSELRMPKAVNHAPFELCSYNA